MIKWQTKEFAKGNFRYDLKPRYHFSDIALEQFTNNFILQTNSMQEYINSFITNYATHARKGYNALYRPCPMKTNIEIMEEIKRYIHHDTLYPILSNIVYGYIMPELEKIDDLRLSVWISYYGIDAAESTIPLKFGPMGKGSNKFRLHASNNHICDD